MYLFILLLCIVILSVIFFGLVAWITLNFADVIGPFTIYFARHAPITKYWHHIRVEM